MRLPLPSAQPPLTRSPQMNTVDKSVLFPLLQERPLTLHRALQALPTAAHALLARLSLPTLRAPLLPSCTSFTLITQNVDHLSPRALLSLDPAARVEDSIIEMHGSIVRPRCTRCGVVDQERGEREAPICAAFEGVVERVESGEGEEKVERRELPRCTASNCAGLMRPGVVWFGESPARMEECGRVLEQADVLLVVGTSGTVRPLFARWSERRASADARTQVYPAAGFAAQVKRHGGIVAVFNLEGSEGDEEADFAVRGKCEETLPALFDL